MLLYNGAAVFFASLISFLGYISDFPVCFGAAKMKRITMALVVVMCLENTYDDG